MIGHSWRFVVRTMVISSTAAFFGEAKSVIYADTPATQPAAVVDASELSVEIGATAHEVTQALGNDRKFADPAWRASVGPHVIPSLKKLVGELDDLSLAAPRSAIHNTMVKQQATGMLIALGDQSTIDHVKAMANEADPLHAIEGRAFQLSGLWYQAGSNADAQKGVADDLSKFDVAHPDSNVLTLLTAEFLDDAKSPELKEQLRSLIENTLTTPIAAQFKRKLAVVEASERAQASLQNKPLIVKGTDLNDAAFTTADWKGKVVLVDFWATWCGPCVAELPRVKQIYSQYHGKGLEIVGVSNDYSVDDLKQFVVKQNMPWPQLFDATAADSQEWNSITKGCGIDALPTMYLVDRKGIVRSITALTDMEILIPKLLAEAQ